MTYLFRSGHKRIIRKGRHGIVWIDVNVSPKSSLSFPRSLLTFHKRPLRSPIMVIGNVFHYDGNSFICHSFVMTGEQLAWPTKEYDVAAFVLGYAGVFFWKYSTRGTGQGGRNRNDLKTKGRGS